MGYIDNILKQPLPFYTDTSQQAFNAKIYESQVNFIHNWCTTTRLIPFTLTRSDLSSYITHVYLVDSDGTETDIYSNIPTGDIPIYSTESGTDYICYLGNQNINPAMTEGYYHLKITDGTNTWYSEKFCVRDGDDYLEFEYYNSFDAWGFVYQTGFKNRLRLRTILLNSIEYEEYKEVVENDEKDEIAIFKKLTKIYSLNKIPIWDYTNDALNLMSIHDHITLKYNSNESDIINIKEIISESIANTDYVNVQIKFTLRNKIYEPTQNLSITDTDNEEFFLLLQTGDYLLKSDGGKFILNV